MVTLPQKPGQDKLWNQHPPPPKWSRKTRESSRGIRTQNPGNTAAFQKHAGEPRALRPEHPAGPRARRGAARDGPGAGLLLVLQLDARRGIGEPGRRPQPRPGTCRADSDQAGFKNRPSLEVGHTQTLAAVPAGLRPQYLRPRGQASGEHGLRIGQVPAATPPPRVTLHPGHRKATHAPVRADTHGHTQRGAPAARAPQTGTQPTLSVRPPTGRTGPWRRSVGCRVRTHPGEQPGTPQVAGHLSRRQPDPHNRPHDSGGCASTARANAALPSERPAVVAVTPSTERRSLLYNLPYNLPYGLPHKLLYNLPQPVSGQPCGQGV